MRHRPEEIDALALEARAFATAAEREAHLDRVCGSDAELRAAIEERLADAPTATGGARPTDADTLAEKPGSILGPYRLIRVLGQGGFGTVFLAEQDKPIRREVALKIIKLGMDTREVIARFDAERQALAMMDHPGIARVFDAGATETGRPYFVMELVRGVPITQYCDAHDLPVPERLRLFLQVCAAVQHAHQKGIIHRDIKPSNVLIADHEGAPYPKVIDFGIAKATNQGAGDHTAFTAMGQIIGTPAYMSPEQAGLDGLDVDTRSDVYSLGVLLYELLTGTVPFDTTTLRGAFWLELQRMIREQEPSKPSARVSSLAAGTLRGDLDWIVMKSLEKDRARRYDSPRDLGSDLERHMRNEPVTAGPPSATYRMKKFVRRHRFGVGTAAVAILVLVGFAATMTVQARRIAVERDRANREREISDRVADFQASMLQRIRPLDMGRSIVSDLRGSLDARQAESLDGLLAGINPTDTARRVLDAQILTPAVDAVAAQFGDQPETEARMRLALARTYRSLGVPDKALAQAQRAEDISAKTFGPEARQTLLSRGVMAIAYWDLGRLDDCEKILTAVVPVWQRVYGPEDADGIKAKIQLGVLTMRKGQYAEAQKLFEEGLAGLEKKLGPDHKDLINPLENIATALMNQAKEKEAAPYLERAVAIRKDSAGAEDLGALATEQRLAQVYQRSGRPKDAEALQQKVLETLTHAQGEKHPKTIEALASLGQIHRMQGRLPEAESTTGKALDMRRAILGGDHPDTLSSIDELALTLSAMGRQQDAEALFREGVDRARRVFGPEAPPTLDKWNNLATSYWFQGRYEETAKIYEQVLDISKRTRGEDAEPTVFAMSNLAVALAQLGRLDEAQALNEKAVEIRKRTFGLDHRLTLHSMAGLADVANRRGQFDEAEKILVAVLAGRRKALGPDDLLTFETWFSLATTYERLGRDGQARPLLVELLEHQRAVLGATHEQTLDTLRELGRIDANAGRPDDARKSLSEAVSARRAVAAAANASPLVLDKTAQLLLLCEVEDLRDAKEALALARRANDLTGNNDATYLRTLARAWLDNGDRARAVETQKRALDRLPAASPDRGDYQAELAEYRARG